MLKQGLKLLLKSHVFFNAFTAKGFLEIRPFGF